MLVGVDECRLNGISVRGADMSRLASIGTAALVVFVGAVSCKGGPQPLRRQATDPYVRGNCDYTAACDRPRARRSLRRRSERCSPSRSRS